jgi:hypothetical protein
MPLAGTFEVLDIAEILDVLARGAKSGRLPVRAGSVHATILMKDAAAAAERVGPGSG